MDFEAMVDRLEADARVLRQMIDGVSREQASWKPAPDKWSILEVTVHLLDEEREDFRVRVEHMLRDPQEKWPPIDPGGWVKERDYAGKDLNESLASFLEEREKSIKWLRGLKSPAWDNEKQFENGWSPKAGDIFAAWVAHDILHIRQLTKLHYDYVCHLADPHEVDYAGDW